MSRKREGQEAPRSSKQRKKDSTSKVREEDSDGKEEVVDEGLDILPKAHYPMSQIFQFIDGPVTKCFQDVAKAVKEDTIKIPSIYFNTALEQKKSIQNKRIKILVTGPQVRIT